jgi:putative transposase
LRIDEGDAREEAPSLARKLRMEYPGAIYHILNRGDRREAILRDDQDRKRLLSTLGEPSQKTSWEVHDRDLGLDRP